MCRQLLDAFSFVSCCENGALKHKKIPKLFGDCPLLNISTFVSIRICALVYAKKHYIPFSLTVEKNVLDFDRNIFLTQTVQRRKGHGMSCLAASESRVYFSSCN